MPIVDYYTKAGPDYEFWSPKFNMHFGYWSPGMDLRNRESMLEKMNDEVFARIASHVPRPEALLDLGCGLGAATRAAARAFRGVRKVTGVSVVPWQIEKARAFGGGRVEYLHGDYTKMPFRPGSYDAAFAIESSCYAPGTDKSPLLEEVKRVIRPGGRLVIADAMLRHELIRNPMTRAAHRALCASWELATMGVLGQVTGRLESLGFTDIRVDDISWNVAPSVLHVPAVTLRFLAKEARKAARFRSYRFDRYRWGNGLAGLPLLVFGFDRRASGYFIVSATRGPEPRKTVRAPCARKAAARGSGKAR